MKTSFGPWTTAIHSGPRAQLSTFWKRRLALLSLASRSSSNPGRSAIVTLAVVAIVVVMLPTLSGVRAIAEQEQSPVEAQDQPRQARSVAAPDATANDEFKEGWKRTFPIPYPPLGEGDTYVTWVEGGWLHVKRQTASGETDWHIVLARATDPTPPTVMVKAGDPNVAFSYRDGRYFVRESYNILRSVREVRGNTEGSLPTKGLLDRKYKSSGVARSREPLRVFSTWKGETWFVATGGPNAERFEWMVRLNPSENSTKGHGVSIIRGGPMRGWHGDTWVIDDGELLVAERTIWSMYKAQAAEKAIRDAISEKLPGSSAPALDGTEWLNAEGPLAWDDLRGKVVLLDFWGTWCGPCVKKMPDVQALHEKYQDKGLVVIGVHSTQAAETCAEFAEKNNITFPLVLDTGKTAEHYAIASWPAYFLIDKTGKITAPASNRIPEEQEIERLLSQ